MKNDGGKNFVKSSVSGPDVSKIMRALHATLVLSITLSQILDASGCDIPTIIHFDEAP